MASTCSHLPTATLAEQLHPAAACYGTTTAGTAGPAGTPGGLWESTPQRFFSKSSARRDTCAL